jgi:tripartite-type tricarboxylate transporter receptor subunit TctC
MSLSKIITRLAVVAAVICPSIAAAQTDFPARPIRLIVPFAPGGGNDLLARYLSGKLNARWGQPVVVENKPGAGGNIGAEFVARSQPDGYTLLLVTNTVTINPYLQKNIPFDIRTDFAPLALLAATPFALVVTSGLPVNSVSELIAHAKAVPGKLSYASTGVGTPHHLGMELFKSLTGTDIVHVPYRGSVPGLTDTSTGQTQVMLATINAAMPFLDGKRVRALGVGEKQRIAALPDVPTVIEAGVPGFEVTAWYGVLAPAATPSHVQQKLGEAILQAARDHEMKEKLGPAGFEVTPDDGPALRRLIEADLQRWGKVAAQAGIKPE